MLCSRFARMHRGRRWWLAAIGVAVATGPASAVATEVYGSARTVGEGYMVQGPGREPWFVTRRRLVQ
ncbi:MAG: hypothetical protein B7733_09760 [Myxococcales bacterium FL481]|nr:MAG: hypothetical protein B7733_09760 [Myxococcales bacterium FL481]